MDPFQYTRNNEWEKERKKRMDANAKKYNDDSCCVAQAKEVTISERLVKISQQIDEVGNTINAIRENLFGANEQETDKCPQPESAEQMLDSIEGRLHTCVKEAAYVSSKL